MFVKERNTLMFFFFFFSPTKSKGLGPQSRSKGGLRFNPSHSAAAKEAPWLSPLSRSGSSPPGAATASGNNGENMRRPQAPQENYSRSGSFLWL